MHRLSLGNARKTEPGSRPDRAVTPMHRGPRPALCGLCTFIALPAVVLSLSVTVFSSTARAQGFSTGQVAVNPLATNPAWATLVFAPAGTATLTASPSAMSFSVTSGGAPVSQQLSVSESPSGSLPVTLSSTSTPSGWLSLSPTSGTTPLNVTVTVNPQGLNAGNYTGTIAVADSGGVPCTSGASSCLVSVSLAATQSGSAPQVLTITNNASNQPGAVAPGELIVIKGNNLGPTTPASFSLNAQGGVDPKLAGVRVLFSSGSMTYQGTPIYVSATQINATVPWEIAGQSSTNVVVEYNSIQSTPITLQVADVSPAIYTLDSSGSGQAVALNQSGSINGVPGSPGVCAVTTCAPDGKGQVLILYATGGGVTNPAGTTGSVSSLTTLMPLNAKSSVTVGGQAAPVLFAGAAPGLVTGVIQLNVQLPAGVTGTSLPVVFSLNGVQSTTVPTIDVQ